MPNTKSVLIIDGNPVADITKQATKDYVEVEQVTGGTKTYRQLLNELWNEIDVDKITGFSYIEVIYADNPDESNIFHIETVIEDGSLYEFTYSIARASLYRQFTFAVKESTSDFITMNNGTVTDTYTSSIVPVGTKITLYYGSASMKADFETHANKCMLSNGNDVENFLGKSKSDITSTGLTFSNCSLVSGGYCKVGNLVIIEMRIKITSVPSTWNAIVSGLPSAGTNEVPLTAVNLYNNLINIALDIAGPNMRYLTGSVRANDELNISGIYLS